MLERLLLSMLPSPRQSARNACCLHCSSSHCMLSLEGLLGSAEHLRVRSPLTFVPFVVGVRDAGEQPSAETAAEVMQLRRKLLLSERRKAAAQRTAALLAERGLTLPPDLPRTPRSVQSQQQQQHQQQQDQHPAAAETSAQRLKRRRTVSSAAGANPEGTASIHNRSTEVVKLQLSPPQGEHSLAAKRRRTEVVTMATEQVGEAAHTDGTSPATTEVQAGGTASTDIAAAMEAGAGTQTVTSPDRRVPAPRAPRGDARRSVAAADPPASVGPDAASVPSLAGGANGSLAPASRRQPAEPESSTLLTAAAPLGAAARASEKLLTALLAADAVPATPNVKARAGPMLAVSRPLTGFGDMAAKVCGLSNCHIANLHSHERLLSSPMLRGAISILTPLLFLQFLISLRSKMS